MADILEGTSEFNRHHAHVTGQIPIVVSDDERHDMFAQAMTLAHDDERHDTFPIKDFADWAIGEDEPIVPQCDLENPESCESCQ